MTSASKMYMYPVIQTDPSIIYVTMKVTSTLWCVELYTLLGSALVQNSKCHHNNIMKLSCRSKSNKSRLLFRKSGLSPLEIE